MMKIRQCIIVASAVLFDSVLSFLPPAPFLRSHLSSSRRNHAGARTLILSARKGQEVEPSLPSEQPPWKADLSFPWDSLLLFGLLPLLATLFPPLVHVAKDATAETSTREAAISAILVGKRVYVYLLAFTVVALAGLRGANDAPQFGTRLTALTAEILGLDSTIDLEPDGSDDINEGSFPASPPPQSLSQKLLPSREQLSQQLEVLDSVSPEAQAGGLPLLVGSSLATSLLLLQLPKLLEKFTAASSSSDPESLAGPGAAWAANAAAALVAAAPTLVLCTNALVLALFTRAEMQRAVAGPPGASSIAAKKIAIPVQSQEEFMAASNAGAQSGVILALAFSLTAAAFMLPAAWAWPARDVVSACLAIAVARAAQLPRLPFLLAALAALTVYDAASVLLIGGTVQTATVAAASPAATAAAAAAPGAVASNAAAAATTAAAVSASQATTTAASSGGLASGVAAAATQSAMGAVAVAKVSGGLGGSLMWQPGVFEVRVNGRVSDLLGLGDAVFPALFAIWARRVDTAASLSRRTSSDSSSSSSSPSDSLSVGSEPRGYFTASLAGFVVGCGACELAPSVTGRGLPALLVLLPTTLLAVGALGAARGELRGLWEFDPAPSSAPQVDN